jgi:tRNA dimethylallyltransferase
MASAACDVLAKVGSQVALSVQEQLLQMFTMKGRRVIVLAGPTGVGKTSLSLRLAALLDGEIVSADAIQVYKGMDIGTAKVSKEDRDRIPHHLIDVCDITRPYNVHDFCTEAKAALEDIISRGRVPIIVGGTGFYIRGLMYGPPSGPPSDAGVRDRLEAEMDYLGSDVLFNRLQDADPLYASTITRNDRHKIIRGLEIMELSGKRVSDFSWKHRRPLPLYDFRCWFIDMPRKMLYDRLAQRCEEMLTAGLLDEVVALDRSGLRNNRTASQAIGYRQALEFLSSAGTPEDYTTFVTSFKVASHHLAKRQVTWFRREPYFRWVDISEIPSDALLDLIASDYSSAAPLCPDEPPQWDHGVD